MYCLKGCDYPAIICEEGAETSGKILMNVNNSDLQILSFFEGDEYAKRKVKVFCNNKDEDALTFVWAKGKDRLENQEWDFAGFQRNRLKFYLDELI